MKKILLPVVSLLIAFSAQAQKLARVNISATGDVENIGFELNGGVLVNVSKDGAIGKFGVDRYKGVRENYRGDLDEYVGRVEYYNENENEAFRGKVRSIGGTMITYYASFDNEAKVGKVKSIGNLKFDYYLLSENDAFKGNIKSAGSTTFSYYPSYDNEALRGKFKSIGNSGITYYSSLEEPGSKGKIKSIGGSSFSYYPAQYFRAELRGRIKTGNLITQEGGVKYILKY